LRGQRGRRRLSSPAPATVAILQAGRALLPGVRSGVRGTLPGAVWLLATEHRDARAEVPRVRRLQAWVCPGPMPQVPRGVLRAVFLPGSLFLPQLSREAGAGEGRLGGRACLRRGKIAFLRYCSNTKSPRELESLQAPPCSSSMLRKSRFDPFPALYN